MSFIVMLFAGSTTAFLTKSGLQDFESVTDYSPADRLVLRGRIMNYAAPGSAPNRDSTDFVKPLSDIYAAINRDLANTRLMSLGDATRPRYSVIFLSDGQPTENQDAELLCGDAVRRIRQLRDLADDVRLNTVNVFVPSTPSTRASATSTAASRCPRAAARAGCRSCRRGSAVAHRQPERRAPEEDGGAGRR